MQGDNRVAKQKSEGQPIIKSRQRGLSEIRIFDGARQTRLTCEAEEAGKGPWYGFD